MDAKAGGTRDLSPQITVDAPILIPESFVPDLDLRMGLYRLLNEVEDKNGIKEFAAEMIDRFGKSPEETENLLLLIEIKLNAKSATQRCDAAVARLGKGGHLTVYLI